jgi:hypothetical protein
MILASSRILNGTLLTFDGKILKYAQNGYVKAVGPTAPKEQKDKQGTDGGEQENGAG